MKLYHVQSFLMLIQLVAILKLRICRMTCLLIAVFESHFHHKGCHVYLAFRRYYEILRDDLLFTKFLVMQLLNLFLWGFSSQIPFRIRPLKGGLCETLGRTAGIASPYIYSPSALSDGPTAVRGNRYLKKLRSLLSPMPISVNCKPFYGGRRLTLGYRRLAC